MKPFRLLLPAPFGNSTLADITFTRVCVVLGANGVGKSRSFEALKEKRQRQNERTLFVEGGRVVDLPKSARLRSHESIFHPNRDEAQRNKIMKKLGFNFIKKRVGKGFDYLFRRHVSKKVQYAEAVEEWEDGRQPRPSPERTELDRVIRLFGEVFPLIQIEVDVEGEKIICRKSGSKGYSPTDLSDGEKQVLSLLVDLSAFGRNVDLVLVDEPELNLHPSLSARLWNVIESDRPESRFLYATHSLGFALRKNVDTVVVLSANGEAVEVDDLTQLDHEELEHFLGAVPAILSSARAVVIEGKDDSVDTPFYKWVLGRQTPLTVVPVGSASNVVAAVRQLGVWKNLAGRVDLVGIVDRDFRSNKEIGRYENKGCYVLALHEVESFLCLPQLLRAVAQARHLGEIPTEKEITNEIKRYLQSEIWSIATRRVEHQLGLRLGPSISKEQLNTLQGKESVKNTLVQSATEELAKAKTQLSQMEVETTFEEEYSVLQSAISNGDPVEMLKYAPPKNFCHAY